MKKVIKITESELKEIIENTILKESLNIPDIMNSNFSGPVYRTNAGLGYDEWVYLILLNQTKKGYNYLIIGRELDFSTGYEIGSIVDLEDYYVEEYDYNIKDSELFGTFLFHFFLKNFEK